MATDEDDASELCWDNEKASNFTPSSCPREFDSEEAIDVFFIRLYYLEDDE